MDLANTKMNSYYQIIPRNENNIYCTLHMQMIFTCILHNGTVVLVQYLYSTSTVLVQCLSFTVYQTRVHVNTINYNVHLLK